VQYSCSTAVIQPNLQKKTIRVNQWARQTNGGGINRCGSVCSSFTPYIMSFSAIQYKVCCRYQATVNLYFVWQCACCTISTWHTFIFHIPCTFIYENISAVGDNKVDIAIDLHHAVNGFLPQGCPDTAMKPFKFSQNYRLVLTVIMLLPW